MLFQWLAYGDNDGIYEESNDGENILSLPLPQLTGIDLSSVYMGNIGLSALVVWVERLQKKQLMNMNVSPSKIPDGMHSLLLQNVRFYFQILDLFWSIPRTVSKGHQN